VGVVEIELRCEAAEGLADDAARLDDGAEDGGGDGRDGLALLLPGALRGEGGGGADVYETLRATRFADATAEQGDVGSLAASVGVELVEDEEAEAGGVLDEALLLRAGEDKLEHHVVGEEDVGRALADPLALGFVSPGRCNGRS
jgi:hypothetical protein